MENYFELFKEIFEDVDKKIILSGEERDQLDDGSNHNAHWRIENEIFKPYLMSFLEKIEQLPAQEKVYFDAMLLKHFRYENMDSLYNYIEAFKYPNFLDATMKVQNTSGFHPLNEEEKELANSYFTFPHARDSEDYWLYHGRSRVITQDVERPLSLKIELAATTIEDAEKIWKVAYPILYSYDNNIAFKIPRNKTIFEENQSGRERGNAVTIYTTSNEQAFQLMKALDKALVDAKLDVEPYVDSTYFNIGSSGVLSATIDRDYDGRYISRTTSTYNSGRDVRSDIFYELKRTLMGAGVLTKENLKEIEEKEKAMKLGKYKVEKPRITIDDVKSFDEADKKGAIAILFSRFNVSHSDLPMIVKTLGENDKYQMTFDVKTDVHFLLHSGYSIQELAQCTNNYNFLAAIINMIPSNDEHGVEILSTIIQGLSEDYKAKNDVVSEVFFQLSDIYHDYKNLISAQIELFQNTKEYLSLEHQRELIDDMIDCVRKISIDDNQNVFVNVAQLYKEGYITTDDLDKLPIEQQNKIYETLADICLDDVEIEQEE